MTVTAREPVRAPRQRRPSSAAASLVLLCLSLASACHGQARGKHLSGQTVTAACAMCIFKMKGVKGCHWAVEIDDQYYLAEGNLPKNHEPHAPGGMCTMPRKAVVDGDLLNNKFVASRFDLLPADISASAAPPHQHQH